MEIGYTLALSCPDRPGIVFSVAEFLMRQECNITSSQQFEDRDREYFFMRVEFDSRGGRTLEELRDAFHEVADRLEMKWKLIPSDERQRVLIMVSQHGHCLNDLLFRQSIGALKVEIAGVISNHTDFENLVASYGVPFHHVPVTAATKSDSERFLLELVEREGVDLVILARYMQILSDEVCSSLEGRIINIHHSFLPSFKGARPYHQAHERGVKVIGATAHYVTSVLDEGPIIEQEVARVGHDFTVEDLAAVGRDVECQALARAVAWHTEHRVFLSGQRTIVFG
jgi:formyltetrahydrofolate deformylase